MKSISPFSLSFPEAKSVVVSGDIHGDFNLLVYKLCVQYGMTDTLLIVAGDCGFGFEKEDYYLSMARRNARRMSAVNNWIVFVRGNHDNPAYFDGQTFRSKRFIAVPDYSVVQAAGHTVLCVGGAVSVDRSWRKRQWKQLTAHDRNLLSDNPFSKNIYWADEEPVYNGELLDAVCERFTIDTVITHTAPSFCELTTKNGLAAWAEEDSTLLRDVADERATMSRIYERLTYCRQPVTHWCYGHFHQSWHSSIKGVLFLMLDIMEFYQIPQGSNQKA